MLKTYEKYILKHLFLTMVLITFVLVVALWLTQSLRFMALVVERGLSLVILGQMLLYMTPDLMALLLPISFFIGVLVLCHRMSMDQEMCALFASGLSPLEFMRPFFIFSGILIGFLYGLTLYFSPLCFQAFKNLDDDVRHKLTVQMIRPMTFNVYKNMTVYVKEVLDRKGLRGLFVYDERQPDHPVSLQAEQGWMEENQGGVRLILIKGVRHSSSQSRPVSLYFDQYSIDIVPSVRRPHTQKPYELVLSELILRLSSGDFHKDHHRLIVDLHRRFLMPLIVILFAFLGVMPALRSQGDRRGKGIHIMLSILYGFVAQVTLVGLFNIAENHRFCLFLAYGFLMVTIILSLRFFRRI